MLAVVIGERGVPHDDGDLLVGELSDVCRGDRIGLVETTLEQVWQLVELAELPLCEWCICAATNVRRFLVIFLQCLAFNGCSSDEETAQRTSKYRKNEYMSK